MDFWEHGFQRTSLNQNEDLTANDIFLLADRSPTIFEHFAKGIQSMINEIWDTHRISENSINKFFSFLKNPRNIDPSENLVDFFYLSKYFRSSEFSSFLKDHLADDNVLIHNLISPTSDLCELSQNSEYLAEVDSIASKPDRFNRLLTNHLFSSLDTAIVYRLLQKIELNNQISEVEHDKLYDFINKNLDDKFILFEFLDISALSNDKYHQFLNEIQNCDSDQAKRYNMLRFPTQLILNSQKYQNENEQFKQSIQNLVDELQRNNDDLKNKIRSLEVDNLKLTEEISSLQEINTIQSIKLDELTSKNAILNENHKQIFNTGIDFLFSMFQIPNENGNFREIHTLNFIQNKPNQYFDDWMKAYYDHLLSLSISNDSRYLNNLGFCYNHGIGILEDHTKAFELYQTASSKANVTATYNLGYCYEKGFGVTQSFEKASEFYQKASDLGHAEATFQLASDCFRNQDKTRTIELYQKASDLGHTKATLKLGICYYDGKGISKDRAKAVQLFQKAADSGDCLAATRLGVCYDLGKGVTHKDPTAALKYYQLGSDNGGLSATHRLAECYEKGRIVNMNWTKAIELYQKAADAGLAKSLFHLGLCYENGMLGLPQSIEKAKEFYNKASKKGYSKATKRLVEINSDLPPTPIELEEIDNSFLESD